MEALMVRFLCRLRQYWRSGRGRKIDTYGLKAIAPIYKANDARLEPDMRGCCTVSWHGQSTNVVHDISEGSIISLIEASTTLHHCRTTERNGGHGSVILRDDLGHKRQRRKMWTILD